MFFCAVTEWNLLKVRKAFFSNFIKISHKSPTRSTQLNTVVFFLGLCPHQSAPVEMDESMTSSSLGLTWPPPCRQCKEHTESSKHDYGEMSEASPQVNQWRPCERKHFPKSMESSHTNLHSASRWPCVFHGQVWSFKQDMIESRKTSSSSHHQHRMMQESLEPPLPLMSETQYPVSQLAGQCD